MTHTIEDLNLNHWYIDRELAYCPDHFVASRVDLTPERYLWIQEKLVGRFVRVASRNSDRSFEMVPAFEDPSEMLFYELVWG
jgi:hypothetical protein